jgi:cation:H+ antiporter
LAGEDLSLLTVSLAFFAAMAVITLAGIKMSSVADRLADVTGLGEAVTGAIFLGASTSLSGIVTSVTAAASGHPELAVSNAVGGIAAQTAFIAIADFTYRSANLEHAAPSVSNIVQSVTLVGLLAIPMLAMSAPPITFFGVHPATILILAGYGFGLRLTQGAQKEPMWEPADTDETIIDEADEPPGDSKAILRLAMVFAGLAVVVAIAGFVVAKTGVAIADKTGLSEGVVGTLFTAVATSMPELVTTIAAVRRGALTLAVSGVIGGNMFDVLFLAFADTAYRDGSIYHAISDQQVFTIALTICMTALLLLGLLHRERHGPANVGFESIAILGTYAGGMILLATAW